MTSLSKISGKRKKKRIVSWRELNPGVQHGKPATNKVNHQVSLRIIVMNLKENHNIDFKIMKTLCTVQYLSYFFFQYPFFFKIS